MVRGLNSIVRTNLNPLWFAFLPNNRQASLLFIIIFIWSMYYLFKAAHKYTQVNQFAFECLDFNFDQAFHLICKPQYCFSILKLETGSNEASLTTRVIQCLNCKLILTWRNPQTTMFIFKFVKMVWVKMPYIMNKIRRKSLTSLLYSP